MDSADSESTAGPPPPPVPQVPGQGTECVLPNSSGYLFKKSQNAACVLKDEPLMVKNTASQSLSLISQILIDGANVMHKLDWLKIAWSQTPFAPALQS